MFRSIGAVAAVALLAGFASPSQAQTAAPATPPAAPAAVTPATPGVVATTNNPNLAVATLKLEHGQRLSKVIGADVYNAANEKMGVVDDLIMTADDKVSMLIVSVGGVLGLGGKLVAVPWGEIREDAGKVVLAGASKDSLNGMPNFQY